MLLFRKVYYIVTITKKARKLPIRSVFSIVAMLVETVNEIVIILRPTAYRQVVTDWFTGGYLKWCLMYSRNFIG